MAYTPTNWVNDSAPAINATNLNKIETGIDDAHDDLDAATDAATAGELIRRDGSGRAKVATPSATGDIATKGYVDGLASNYATAAQGGKADTAVQPSLVDAKGDLLVGTADNTVGRLPVGSDGQMLYADSGETAGVRWGAAPSGGGGVPLAIIPKVGHYLMPNFDAINTSTLGPESSSGLSWGAPILVADEIEIDQISFNVTTADASANAKVLLYAPDAYGYPSTLAVDSGGVSIASTGQKDAGFSPVTLTPGVYWGFIRSTSASSARFTSGNSFTLQSFGSDFFAPTTGRGSSMRADVGTYASPTTTLSSFSYGNPSNVQCLWFGIRRSA